MSGRERIGLIGAVAVCAVALVLPSTAPAPPRTANSGPATLAGTWPGAAPWTMPGTLPDGDVYQPLAIVDHGSSVGTATSPDGTVIGLVEVASGGVRALQPGLAADAVSFDAFAVTAGDIYWMRNLADANGVGHETLWRAGRTSGTATLVTADTGDTLFQGSSYDLQVVGDRLVWVETSERDSKVTEIRSVARDGGPVSTRVVRGNYVLSAWPWLVTEPGATGQPVTLADLDSGARLHVAVAGDASTMCDLTWCTVQRLAGNGDAQIELTHLDGSAPHQLGDTMTGLVAADVTLGGRFVALAESGTGPPGPDPVEQLWLYDIAHGRSALVTSAATAAAASGDYLWWSTGDNESLTWYALDVTTLR